MIYTIRTTSGREDIVVDLLMSKIEGSNIDVKSVFHPAEIKGYVFIEGNIGNIHKAVAGIMHSRGMIEKPIQLAEIQHFLESKKTRLNVAEGDIMEVIGGPFKGERGRIIRVNKIKDEITAELLEASIPIPVTIATEFVKIVKKVKAAPAAVQPVEEPADDDGKSVFDRPDEEHAKTHETRGETEREEKPKKKKSFLEELEEEQR